MTVESASSSGDVQKAADPADGGPWRATSNFPALDSIKRARDTGRIIKAMTDPFPAVREMREFERTLQILREPGAFARAIDIHKQATRDWGGSQQLRDALERNRRISEAIAKAVDPIAIQLASPTSIAIAKEIEFARPLSRAFQLSQTARLFKDHEEALGAAQRWLERAATDVAGERRPLPASTDLADDRVEEAVASTAPANLPQGAEPILRAFALWMVSNIVWEEAQEALGVENEASLYILCAIVLAMLAWLNRRKLP